MESWTFRRAGSERERGVADPKRHASCETKSSRAVAGEQLLAGRAEGVALGEVAALTLGSWEGGSGGREGKGEGEEDQDEGEHGVSEYGSGWMRWDESD